MFYLPCCNDYILFSQNVKSLNRAERQQLVGFHTSKKWGEKTLHCFLALQNCESLSVLSMLHWPRHTLPALHIIKPSCSRASCCLIQQLIFHITPFGTSILCAAGLCLCVCACISVYLHENDSTIAMWEFLPV